MANAQNTFEGLRTNVDNLIAALENLQTYKGMIDADPSLAAALVTYANSRGWVLTTQDITNVADTAITQILFTFNSGSPTIASLFYKVS